MTLSRLMTDDANIKVHELNKLNEKHTNNGRDGNWGIETQWVEMVAEYGVGMCGAYRLSHAA